MAHKTKVQISNWISTAIIVFLALSARHATDKVHRPYLYAIAGVLGVGYLCALNY